MGCNTSSSPDVASPDGPEVLAPDAQCGLEPVKPNPKQFLDLYKVRKDKSGKEMVLGEGNYASVKLVDEASTGASFAAKCIDGSKLHKEDVEGLKTELSLLRQLQHPNIIFLKDYFEDRTKNWYYVVTELLEGGELFTAIVTREKYSEADARDTVRTIAEALSYCHARGVVHRDLKPENIMLDKDGPDAKIKIIDFGFATKIGTKDPMLHTACGTPGYVAPEIIPAKRDQQPRYGPGVDVWALGVITYILLCGYPPFTNDENNEAELFKTIRRGQYYFYEEDWEHISSEAKDLIDSMLVVDADKVGGWVRRRGGERWRWRRRRSIKAEGGLGGGGGWTRQL